MPNVKKAIGSVGGALKQAGGFLRRHREALLKALLVVFLAAVCVLPALVDNTVIGYLPIVVLLLTVLVMGLYLLVLNRFIKVEESQLACTCQRGDTVDVALRVENAGLLLAQRIDAGLYISDLEGKVDIETTESFALLPKESRELEIAARFDHVGCYRVGLKSLMIQDLLGLFKKQRALRGEGEVVVEPRVIELGSLPVSQEQISDNSLFRQSVVSDGYDYVGLRDYQMGDSMKSVHWKASARHESLLTRIRESQINPGVSVVVDLCTQWPTGEQLMCCYDAVIESALAVSSYARGNGIDCGLVAADAADGLRSLGLSSQRWDPNSLLQNVPRLVPYDQNMAASDAVRAVTRGVHSPSNIVVCSSCPTSDLVESLIEARMRGKNALLFAACPIGLEEDEKHAFARSLSRLSEAQVPYAIFSDARELEGGAL